MSGYDAGLLDRVATDWPPLAQHPLGPCSMRVVPFLPLFGPLHPRKVLPTLPDEVSSHCMPCAGCRACRAWRVA